MPVWYSDAYVDTAVAFDTFRKATAIAASLVADPVPGIELLEPEPVDRDALRTAHDDAYVDAVLTGAPVELACSNELGWDAGLALAVRTSTGGVRSAALAALASGGIAGSLSSGLHHAHPGHGSGYCTINGLAIAAAAALAAGAQRVLVVDLDAHCGGGTAAIIDRRAAAGRGRTEQMDVSVDSFDSYVPGVGVRLTMAAGPAYLDVVERELASITAPGGIDLVLYNAGMDPHHLAGGVAGIDATTLADRERMVFDWADAHDLPVAWVLAGGYTHGPETGAGLQGLDMDGLVALHRLTITTAAGAAAARN